MQERWLLNLSGFSPYFYIMHLHFDDFIGAPFIYADPFAQTQGSKNRVVE